MTLDQQLRASLAITPAQADARLKLIRAWNELADALDKARRATTNRKIAAIHHWMERSAHWFCAITTLSEVDDMIHATLIEASTPALAKEIERRATDPNETPQARAEATRVMRKLGKRVAPKPVKEKARV
jgi:hypothetical protein